MKGHLRRRGNAWELRAYVGIDPITNRQRYLARNDLSPSTMRGYERIIRSHITPTLSNVPLARLRTAQLDRFYAQLREKGGQNGTPLTPATVRQAHAVLRRALHQGVRWGWIAANPASLASPPLVRARGSTRRVPTMSSRSSRRRQMTTLTSDVSSLWRQQQPLPAGASSVHFAGPTSIFPAGRSRSQAGRRDRAQRDSRERHQDARLPAHRARRGDGGRPHRAP